jgi:uncharacterized protein
MRRIVFAALIGMAVVVGCQKSSVPPASPPPAATAGGHPSATRAQPTLPTIRIWLGAEELRTEMARTDDQVMTGMMFRTNMDEMAGMIFVFPGPWRPAFWMKNCPLPLSCAYINPDGTIAEIHDLQAQDTNAVEASSRDIQYVLEVNQGWFARHHIGTGTVMKTERGTLHETFFPQNR